MTDIINALDGKSAKEPLNNLPCTCLKRFGLREVNYLPSTPEP